MDQYVGKVLDEIRATPDQRRSIRASYRDAWDSTTVDASQLDALLDAEVGRWVPLLHDMNRVMGEIHTVLTPESLS